MVPYFRVLIIMILLFRVLYKGPLFSETLISSDPRPQPLKTVTASSYNHYHDNPLPSPDPKNPNSAQDAECRCSDQFPR